MRSDFLPRSALMLTVCSGCAHGTLTTESNESQPTYELIAMGHNIGYLIDPRTESCVLVYGEAAAIRVDCQKLKANVPEAQTLITWTDP